MTRSVFVIASAIAATLLAGLTAAGLWPAWIGVLITGGCLCAAYALALTGRRRPPQPAQVFEPVPALTPPTPPPPAVRTVHVQAVPMPSSDPNYRFLLYCTVCWRPGPAAAETPHPQPAEFATRMVVHQAAQVTAKEPPDRHDLIQHRLSNDLAAVMQDRSGSVEFWACNVVVTLPKEDLERQHRLATARKDYQWWEQQVHLERGRRAYLRTEVLPDTGSAVVWWLSQSQDMKQVQPAVELIGSLARLSAAANNREIEPVLRTFVNDLPDLPQPAPAYANGAHHGSAVNGEATNYNRVDRAAACAAALADFVTGVNSEPERSQFGDHIARLTNYFGDDELARRIRVDFQAPDLSSTASEPPDENLPAPDNRPDLDIPDAAAP